MPGLIEHIDAIARKRGRAMLYLEFHPMPLEYAMCNAEPDGPGFRERWGEDL